MRVDSQLGFRDDGPLPPDSSTLGLGQPLKIMKPTNQPQPNQIIRDQRKKERLEIVYPKKMQDRNEPTFGMKQIGFLFLT